MGDEPLQLDLSKAENALERGDYGQCLAMLDPLATSHPVSDPEGSRIRLLMVTAWMGQGREQEAIATCRLLSRAGDPDRRQQARQLLAILEAPSLERPERWSMRLPEMKLNATGSAAPVQPVVAVRVDQPHLRRRRQGRPRVRRRGLPFSSPPCCWASPFYSVVVYGSKRTSAVQVQGGFSSVGRSKAAPIICCPGNVAWKQTSPSSIPN